MNRNEIIQAIKQRRIQLQLSQQQLAAKTGLFKGDISNIEAGKVNITLDKLITISNALQLQITLIPS